MSGVDDFLVHALDLIEAAGVLTDEQMSTDRAEHIRAKVLAALSALAQDALYWADTPPDGLNGSPLWHELRDTVVSVLFDMDRDQDDLELGAEHVRTHCL